MGSLSRSWKNSYKVTKQGRIISFAYSDTGEWNVGNQVTEQPDAAFK
jgi:hypothetical protein